MIDTLRRWLRHAWLDADDARRALPPALTERLRERVAASEHRHTGQIRICVEASLPLSDLWRHWRDRVPLRQLVRERALAMFSSLRIWDTAQNNGVLIYLLLAERAIEVVADRGLNQHVTPGQWQALALDMGYAFKAGHYEQGLGEALDAVSALLVQHFPAPPGGSRPNELPDEPVLG